MSGHPTPRTSRHQKAMRRSARNILAQLRAKCCSAQAACDTAINPLPSRGDTGSAKNQFAARRIERAINRISGCEPPITKRAYEGMAGGFFDCRGFKPINATQRCELGMIFEQGGAMARPDRSRSCSASGEIGVPQSRQR